MNIFEKTAAKRTIQVPAPTAWPLVAAFGLTFIVAGLLTHVLVSALGVVTLIAGLVGWFREVLPVEAHEAVPVKLDELLAPPLRSNAPPLAVGEDKNRARLPLAVYPYSAGVWGGLVGGAAMSMLAVLYGVVAYKSVWYPINLLAATASASIASMDTDQLRAFSAEGLLLGFIIHAVGSALVGLLYGIALPMFPRRPMVLGGILAPVFWTGILYGELSIINPVLQSRIDWGWFMASQFAFGVVAGFVVTRRERVSTMQHMSFAARAGIEFGGPGEDKDKPL